VSTLDGAPVMRGERLLEILAMLLLGIATVGSAWCGYQASKWNGEQSSIARSASDARVEASRLFGLATQAVSYDASFVATYAQAYQAGNTTLTTFYRTSLVRPAFLPVLDEWEAEVKAGKAPANLLSDPAYLDAQYGPYREAEARSETLSLASEEAGNNSDAFVLTTLLFAVALFFAGVTSSFRFRTVRIFLLIGAVVTIAFAAARLIDLPVA
jgi:hypothetical protein